MMLTNRLRAASVLFAALCATALAYGAQVTGKTAAVPPDNEGTAERADRHGDPLPAAALMRLGTSRFRHGGSIYAVAYSADGKLLITGNAVGMQFPQDEASVVVWDAETGKRIRTWDRHAHVVRSVAFSADNKQIAVVNGYGKLHVFDVATGKEPRQFTTKSPGQAFFTPDGTLVVSDAGRLRRWEVITGKELPPLGHNTPSVSVTVAADGKTIASWARGGVVRIWDADGQERRQFVVPGKSGLVAGLVAGWQAPGVRHLRGRDLPLGYRSRACAMACQVRVVARVRAGIFSRRQDAAYRRRQADAPGYGNRQGPARNRRRVPIAGPCPLFSRWQVHRLGRQ